MVDGGFEEEMRDVLSFFKSQRQTLMFSATMPAKIKAFAESALIHPIEVRRADGVEFFFYRTACLCGKASGLRLRL